MNTNPTLSASTMGFTRTGHNTAVAPQPTISMNSQYASHQRYASGPYMHQSTRSILHTNTSKKRYSIVPPRPGQKSAAYTGIDGLREMKTRVNARPIVKSVGVNPARLLQPTSSSPPPMRYVLKIPRLPPQVHPIPVNRPITPPVGGRVIRHRDWAAASTTQQLPPPAKEIRKMFACAADGCDWTGSSSAALKRHSLLHAAFRQKETQQQQTAAAAASTPSGSKQKSRGGVRCSECAEVSYSRHHLLQHMHDAHCIDAPSFNRHFESKQRLYEWLQGCRHTHAIDFVTASGAKIWTGGARVMYMQCSRSGDPKERQNKKHCRMPRPTIKCGKTCMAYIKIRLIDDKPGALDVEGCLYHSGHDIDATRLLLTEPEVNLVWTLEQRFPTWDIEPDMMQIRSILGKGTRFRLVPDQQLREMLPIWLQSIRQNRWKSPSSSLALPPPSISDDCLSLLDDDILNYDSDGDEKPMPSTSSGYKLDVEAYD